MRSPGPVAPVVLQGSPDANQIVSAVNQNTARVRSYSTNTAKFSVPGLTGIPMLRGNISLERPNNFRLTAGTAVLGSEIDLGSNAELLWFWVKRNSPPALYFCRHDQFASSGAKQMLPIDPTWIGDALGLVQLNPDAAYEGPFPKADGTLELKSTISTPTGPMTRVVVVDATRAWVLEQHLYELAGGAPVASAIASDFRYDPTAQVSLPRKVTIRVPASDLSLKIDVGQVSVNVPVSNPALIWSPPALEGYSRVDLGATSPGVPIDTSSIPLSSTIPASSLEQSQAATPSANLAAIPNVGQPQAGLPSAGPPAAIPSAYAASNYNAPAVQPASYQPPSAGITNTLPAGGIPLDGLASPVQ